MARSHKYRVVRLNENSYQILLKEWRESTGLDDFNHWVKVNKGATYRGAIYPNRRGQFMPGSISFYWTAEYKFVFRDPKQATMFILKYV